MYMSKAIMQIDSLYDTVIYKTNVKQETTAHTYSYQCITNSQYECSCKKDAAF